MASSKTISDFKSNIGKDFARSNLFRIEFGSPGTSPGTQPTNYKFLVKATSLPSTSMGSIAVPYQGRVFNVPGDRTFEPWSTTIMNTENYELRKYLESWVGKIQATEYAYQEADSFNYMANLKVSSLKRTAQSNNKLETIREYKFFNAFPSSISAMDLDFASNDTIQEFTCEWQFSHWEVV